jgi:hypothetical protein
VKRFVSLQFRDFRQSLGSLDGVQPDARPLLTQKNTNRISLEWDSSPWPQRLSEQRHFVP